MHARFYTTNGDCVRAAGQPVFSRVYFVCDENATTPFVDMIDDNYWDCYVKIKMTTNLACDNSPPPPPPPPPPQGYACLNGDCMTVDNVTGVPLNVCHEMCLQKYMCVKGMCVVNNCSKGIPLPECKEICVNDAQEL
jgi:hypothetical protein